METKVRHIVVALVFDPTLERVLLVRKIAHGRCWMNGRLNGPGGKVEPSDLNLRDAADETRPDQVVNRALRCDGPGLLAPHAAQIGGDP